MIAANMARLLCLLLVLPVCYSIPSQIVRPCPKRNYNCIGRNLAANSQCSISVSGSLPNEYTVSSFAFETPYFNASYVDRNLIVRNHNKCAVADFYYDLYTDNAVLTVACPGLELESTRTLIQHFPGGEDTEYTYDYKGTYPEVILTINLKPANDIDLCNINTFAYVSALPTFYINPKDRKTQQFLSTDLSFLNIFERENMQQRANPLMRIFVNNKLCDFGCNS